jgi:hypothetical protein
MKNKEKQITEIFSGLYNAGLIMTHERKIEIGFDSGVEQALVFGIPIKDIIQIIKDTCKELDGRKYNATQHILNRIKPLDAAFHYSFIEPNIIDLDYKCEDFEIFGDIVITLSGSVSFEGTEIVYLDNKGEHICTYNKQKIFDWLKQVPLYDYNLKLWEP